MSRILILTDYRGAFYSTYESRRTSLTMDVDKLSKSLTSCGFDVEVSKFSQIRFDKKYQDVYVLYTSSEDEGLKYKSYIEDVIVYLECCGAITLPAYKYLRSHHNKSMMELLRYQIFPDSANRLSTKILGTLEELKFVSLKESGRWPKVVKSAYGAGSGLVAKAENPTELKRLVSQYSCSADGWLTEIKEILKSKLRPKYQRRSTHRNKYIVQEMLPGLNGDFKILCYGKRFYCLYRKNRTNDFRASGSGLVSWDIEQYVDGAELLNYASEIYRTLRTPIASLDVAYDGKAFNLIEFQILHFGTLTAEKSDYYYTKTDERWSKVQEVCIIEETLADAVALYIRTGQAGV